MRFGAGLGPSRRRLERSDTTTDSQSLFGVLILATARPLWIWFGRSSTRERAEAARVA